MLLLASTSDKIQLVTSAAGSIDVHSSWADNLSGSVTPGRTNTPTISTATTTDVVASPAASTIRKIKLMSVRNRHASVANDVTVKHTDGTNNLEIMKVTLQPGEELLYIDITGFVVLLANGTQKIGNNYIDTDGVVFTAVPITDERGVVDTEQYIQLTSAFTLVSQTAAQKMFNAPANGRLTVGGSRTYHFESQFDLTAMSATSGTFGWSLGGTATFTTVRWQSEANKATLATASASQSTMNVTAANVALSAATTNTIGWAYIRGIVRVNAGGTIIPQVSLGIAAAAVVSLGSWFRIWPLGSSSVQSVGNWS